MRATILVDPKVWKYVPIPTELHEQVGEVVKKEPEYKSIAEFIRRAVSSFLKNYGGKKN